MYSCFQPSFCFLSTSFRWIFIDTACYSSNTSNKNTLNKKQKYQLNSNDRFGLKSCNRMCIRHTSFCCTIYKSHLTSYR